MHYDKASFNPALDILGTGITFLLTLCQLSNSLTIYEYDNYDVDHLKLKDDSDWQIYANKVKDVMLKTLNCKSSEIGYSEKNLYLDALEEKLPKTKVNDKSD